MILDTSWSNWAHTLCWFAAGHLIRCCWTTLLSVEELGAWRFWALWGVSGPGSSCVSPEVPSVRCAVLTCTEHFILAWWIFRPRMFLQTLPQMHLDVIVVVSPFAKVVVLGSVLLGCSSSPLSGSPGGICSLVGFFLWEGAGWDATPSCPDCRLSVLSPVSPVVTNLFSVVTQSFLGVTG